MCFNARSLNNKLPELYSLLDGSLYGFSYDLVFVCETWLNPNTSDGLILSGSNYNIIRHDRHINSRGGGICAFIKKAHNYVHIPLPQEFSHLEMLCTDIICNNFKHRYISVYRPPIYDLHQTCELFNCLNMLCDVNHVVSINGDFNFPNFDWGRAIDISALSPVESEFANFIIANGLTQLVTQPTRNAHILDLLMVNDPLAVFEVTVQQPFSTSDHNIVTWRTWFPEQKNEACVSNFDFKRANYVSLAEHMSNINWLELFSFVAPNNIEGIWQIFKAVIMEAIALHVPRHATRSLPIRRFPAHIQRSIKRKRILWRRRHLAGGNAQYALHARRCKLLIKRYHAYKERHLLKSNSLAAFYKHVNTKLNSSCGIAPLRVNNEIIIDDEYKARAFNTYFSSVFSVQSNDLAITANHSQLNSSHAISGIVDFSPRVVYEAMRKTKVGYSVGPDLIPSIFWVKLASELTLPISIIFAASYHFSTLPLDWKCAHVIPLFKKGDPSLASNYRPISLTSTLCKIMESIIKDNLTHFAALHGIINPNQHGFMSGKSTCSQLLETHFDWCSGLDDGGYFDVITIDFRKAFDVVPHNKLLSKLSCLGVCGQTLLWISTFLSDRKQCVSINGKRSSLSNVSSGVIQGSVLGPLLFTLYINDLPAACVDCTIKLFADDVKAYKRICTAADRVILQSALNDLCAWAFKWGLGLSVEKCCFFQIGYHNLTLVYRLGDEILSPCSHILDLGITINFNLKPSQHCSLIASKASVRSKLILKSFLSRDPFILARAFTTYVRPTLEYCSPVWSPHNKCDIDLIENVQRSFTRKLFYICHIAPTSYENMIGHFLTCKNLNLGAYMLILYICLN